MHGFSHSHRSLDNQPKPAVGEVDIGAVVGGMEAIGVNPGCLIMPEHLSDDASDTTDTSR